MELFSVTKCSLQLPMIINMSHFVSQQGVFCLCNFRELGKSIKMFLALVLGHTHKVGSVNGYPATVWTPVEQLSERNALHHDDEVCTPYVCWHSSHPCEHTHTSTAYLMDIWPTLLVDRCDDVFFCFLSCLDELNRSSLPDSDLLVYTSEKPDWLLDTISCVYDDVIQTMYHTALTCCVVRITQMLQIRLGLKWS